MYLALWLLMGGLLSVPVTVVALLVELAGAGFRTGNGSVKVRRSAAFVLAVAAIAAASIPGAGWHAVAFLFPLFLVIGCAAGYGVIEWLISRIR